MKSAVWVSSTLLPVVRQCLSSPRLGITTIHEIDSAHEALKLSADQNTFLVLDQVGIEQLGAAPKTAFAAPVLAICNQTLSQGIGWLLPDNWVSHVVSDTMLEHPYSEEHLANVVDSFRPGHRLHLLDWIGTSLVGRRVRLAHSTDRASRLDRMSEFFAANGIGDRTSVQLRDAAEELLTNAFYDAPVSAGRSPPVSRTQDVSLPEKSGCVLAYGCRPDLAIVRVRDPFGSLSRRRLVEVLSRCARTDMTVEVDETMGGAGLGMWRIFSASTFVAVSVHQGKSTEILVGVAKRTAPGRRPFAFHLYFKERSRKWFRRDVDDDTKTTPLNHSVVLTARQK